MGKNDFAGSVSHFSKAAQAFPDYYEAFYHIGVAETRRGRLEEALPAFQKAIDLSCGRYAWAEFGIGYLLYAEGKTEEAVTALRRGVEVDGNSPDGYTILGMVMLLLDRPDEAAKCAREALLLNPHSAQAHPFLSDPYRLRP